MEIDYLMLAAALFGCIEPKPELIIKSILESALIASKYVLENGTPKVQDPQNLPERGVQMYHQGYPIF